MKTISTRFTYIIYESTPGSNLKNRDLVYMKFLLPEKNYSLGNNSHIILASLALGTSLVASIPYTLRIQKHPIRVSRNDKV